jgi:4-hydroxy 2-oxovalerate aldolase
MKILDCTLRDGGYYNKWDFSEELVTNYLKAVSGSGISFVELGLRNFAKDEFLGPFAYTTESYLNSLDLPSGVIYGVMVDAKTILTSNLSISDAVDALFCEAQSSKIGLVRIAAHFYEVDSSAEIAKKLKDLGYLVGFNLMQAGGKSVDEISLKSKTIASWDCIESLYFADSLGNMDNVEVVRILNAIKEEWKGPIGIHTHNNMGRALDNSLCAITNGVTWIDSTITGMGRGAGNAETESLLAVLSKSHLGFNATPIYELVIRYFEPLQKKYGWGSNLLYFLGAQHNVHPTYIQNLLSDSHLGKDETVGALKYLLAQDGTSKYDGKVLQAALSLNDEFTEPCGDVISNKFVGRKLLLLTNAPSVKEHKRALEIFIKQQEVVVVSLNINETIVGDHIDFVCISHNLKFLSESANYINLKYPVIYPRHRFKQEERNLIRLNDNTINYGVKVSEGTFETHESHCVVPHDLTMAYALAFAMASGFSDVFVAGFEGYDSTDKRQTEMLDVISHVKASKPLFGDLIALTPTTYPIKKSSVYAYI